MKRPDLQLPEGIDFPDTPLSWRPGVRHDTLIGTADGFAWRARRVLGEGDIPAVKQFCKWADTHYLLPGHVVKVVDDHFSSFSPHIRLFTDMKNEEDHTAMLEEFEWGYLGLAPNESHDGLRWWQSNAGSGYGQYPVESVAQLVDLESGELIQYLEDNRHPVGFIALRSDDYLISVQETTTILKRLILAVSGG